MMLYYIYELLLWLTAPLFLTYHWWRSVSRQRPVALAERLGFLPAAALAEIAGDATIWVHAVSVGETLAVRPLLKAIKEQYPERKLIISSTTETGRGVAAKLPEADLCIYFPFDFAAASRRLIKSIKPDLVIIVETEIWPNFLRQLQYSGIPAVMVNGRISDRSYASYLRFSWIFRQVLRNFSTLCMQSAEDARRIIAIGAPQEKVLLTGSLKYDLPVASSTGSDISKLKEQFAIPAGLAVFTAGSTHQGEDEPVISAYQDLLATGTESLLVLVPRHPERTAAVAGLLQRAGIQVTLRSEVASRTTPFASGEVLLVDTIGELMRFYAMSRVVFVGGSLVPVGGHNLLEPASLGVPMLYGPHMNNFREIAAMVESYAAGRQVDNAADLAAVMQEIWSDAGQRQTMADNGITLVRENGGSTLRHMEVLQRYLEPL